MPGRNPFPVPSAGKRRLFRRKLLAWYGRNGRDLPWRSTRDPYRVLVSEVMLQQTQVDRVLPKYHEWLRRFPSFAARAATTEDQALKAWYPLGYNIRPRRLHAIARESVERYGGTLPADRKALRAFKGIGRYTAGAVMSFAFDAREPILDTNVARLLWRVFVARGDPKSHGLRKRLWQLSEVLLPRRRVFDFNQALMDFGALVCVARKPRCGVCPLAGMCRTFRGHSETCRAGLQPRRTPGA